jgi:hypothetical protein
MQNKALGQKVQPIGLQVRRANALRRAQKLLPVIEEIRALGVTTTYAIAKELNRRKIPTPRGAEVWNKVQVARVLRWTAAGSSEAA